MDGIIVYKEVKGSRLYLGAIISDETHWTTDINGAYTFSPTDTGLEKANNFCKSHGAKIFTGSVEEQIKCRLTGIVRRIDDLGRLVIPREIRRKFNIEEGDALEFYTTMDGILIKKFEQDGGQIHGR
jgi:AbrB family looped-hinge helix DNA binding protein